MLRRVFVSALILPWAVCAQVGLQSADVDRIVQESMSAWQTPGVAVAVVQDGKLLYQKGYGVRQVGRPEPVTPETLFAMASTTKAFTTTSLAMLADDGKLKWDDPVRQHLSYFRLADPYADEHVTLRDIVSHHTGLSRHDMLWVQSPWSREEIIRRVGTVPLTQPFRTAYQYQNIMFTAAGEVVGQVSGKGWEGFVQERILNPLGMTRTLFSVTTAERDANHASSHVKETRVTVGNWHNVDNIGGAGAMVSCVADLAHWLEFQLGDGVYRGRRLVSVKNLSETKMPQTIMRPTAPISPKTSHSLQISYGMGWTVRDYKGEQIIEHSGVLDGFRAQVTLMPSRKMGIVTLINLGNTNAAESLQLTLIEAAMGNTGTQATPWLALYQEYDQTLAAQVRKSREEREAKRQKNTHPSLPLAAYAGHYQDSGYGKVTVVEKAGKLHLQWSSFDVPLTHYHFDTFQCDGPGPLSGTLVTFGLDQNARVSRLQMLDVGFQQSEGEVNR